MPIFGLMAPGPYTYTSMCEVCTYSCSLLAKRWFDRFFVQTQKKKKTLFNLQYLTKRVKWHFYQLLQWANTHALCPNLFKSHASAIRRKEKRDTCAMRKTCEQMKYSHKIDQMEYVRVYITIAELETVDVWLSNTLACTELIREYSRKINPHLNCLQQV